MAHVSTYDPNFAIKEAGCLGCHVPEGSLHRADCPVMAAKMRECDHEVAKAPTPTAPLVCVECGAEV